MKVGIVVFDKFLTSEVTAPIEIFAKAGKKGSVPFEPFLVAEEKRDHRQRGGPTYRARLRLRELPADRCLGRPERPRRGALTG